MLANRARKCLGKRQSAKAKHSSLTKTQNKVADNVPEMLAFDLFPMKGPDCNFRPFFPLLEFSNFPS